MARIFILKADITKLDVDAIVNPAHPSLLAGSGLCGSIHRKAGKELEKDCKLIGGCDKGHAVITDSYNLKAGQVIHAVGPHYILDNDKASELLESCYLSIFRLANKHELKSVAIPAISTGIHQYPLSEATDIAFKTASYFLEHENEFIQDIVYAVTSDDHAAIYKEFYEIYYPT